MMYNCLIVDDEPLARKVIEKHLQAFSQFRLVGSVENAMAAFELLHTQTVDLLFLDIQMPSVNGLQWVRSMKKSPPVIFTTAYLEYAAESYNLDAVDYLLKPVSFDRFEKSIHKFLKIAQPEAISPKQFLLVKDEGRLVKIFFSDILYIESRKDYLMIHKNGSSYMKHMTMKAIEQVLPRNVFRRVHRSFIVAVDAVTGIGNNSIFVKEKSLPLGDKYKKEVLGFFRGKIG